MSDEEEEAMQELTVTLRVIRTLAKNLDGLVTEERERRIKNQRTVERVMAREMGE